MKITSVQVKDDQDRLHFETIILEEAKRFVRDYNTEYGIVLNIFEVSREPTDYRMRSN